MSESDVNARCVAWTRRLPGCWAFKVAGGAYQVAGIPDVVGCVRGRFFAAEGKRPGKEPTRIQARRIREIRAAGGAAFVYRSEDEFARGIDAILREADGEGVRR